MTLSTAPVIDTRFWIILREGRIELRDLTASAVLDLEGRGFQRFTIGRGKFPAIVGFAEDPADVGQLRGALNQQDELRNQP